MATRLLPLVALAFIGLASFSQNFEWVGHIGGKSGETGLSVVTDNAGNIYTAGYFEDTVDFDPSETAALNLVARDLNTFVQKLDRDGKLIWAKNFGEGYHTTIFRNFTWPTYMTIDDWGNIYTVGSFNDSTDFDPSPTNQFVMEAHGNCNAFIHKMDTDGNFLWAVGLGNNNEEKAYAIATKEEDVYITGTFMGRVDFDPSEQGVYNLDSWYGYNVFILKLDALGNFIWAKHFGGGWNDPYFVEPYDLKIDMDGNLYLTGWFMSKIDFDPSEDGTLNFTADNCDMFIQKLDPDGDLIWAHQFGGPGIEIGWSVCASDQGNVYITGEFWDHTDFDPGPENYFLTPYGRSDIFILKLDPSGNFLWAKQVGGISSDTGWDIETDNLENAYLVGSFKDKADVDPGPDTMNFISAGSSDGILLTLSPEGNLINAIQFAGAGSNGWFSLAVEESGAIYLTGYFKGISDFDPSISGTYNLDTLGDVDCFVLKLSQSAGIVNSSGDFGISIMPNPFKEDITVKFREKEGFIGISIRTTAGMTVYKSTFHNSSSISIAPDIPPGVYFLTVETQKDRQTMKIINVK